MYSCTDGAKLLAYKTIVRPCMEYGSTMWSPHTAKNINLLESIQRRATRWIKSKHDSTLHQYWWLLKGIEVVYTGTLTYALLYYEQSNSYKFLPFFNFNTNATRSHPLTLQTQSSLINTLRYSFIVNMPFVWNSIPYEILSSSLNSFKSRLRYHLFTWIVLVCICL